MGESDGMHMTLRSPLIAAALLGALALPGSTAAQTSAGDRCAGRDVVPNAKNIAQVEHATLCLVNEERTSRGLGRLTPVGSLQSVASAHAARMVRHRFFEHTSPGGETFVARIKRTGYLRWSMRRWSVGENLAWGSGSRATPGSIVSAWMDSAGHRRNILDRDFDELGLGIATGAPKAGVSGDAATYVNEFGERGR